MFSAFLTLTKPRISLLFAITALSAIFAEGSWKGTEARVWWIVLAVFLVGGGANALNQYFERDIDAKMARTAKKRPLPSGIISPNAALAFAVLLCISGNFILWYFGNLLAMALGVGTILFYSFYYTLYLKPRTPYNIVIGGAAGATGPLMGWAAVSGTLDWAPWLMFLIVFFWTPPHFWALALCCKDDYKNAGYPMLPLVVGDAPTRRQIFYYSLTLLPLCVALYWYGHFGKTYLIGSVFLCVLFIVGALQVLRSPSISNYWRFFGYSIIYLMAIFLLMIGDRGMA